MGLCSVVTVYGRSGFIARGEVAAREIQKLMELGCAAIVRSLTVEAVKAGY